MCFGNHQLSLTLATIFGVIALALIIFYRKKLMDAGADRATVSMQIRKLLEFDKILNPMTPLPYYVISLGFLIHALYGAWMCD